VTTETEAPAIPPRTELLMLKSRYDCYAYSAEIFIVIKTLEAEISWRQHDLWKRRAAHPCPTSLIINERTVSTA
jgi:hypothetical protein